MRFSLSLTILAIIVLTLGPGRAAVPDLRGRWVGSLHTLQGTCSDQRGSTLVIDRDHLSFAPGDGVLVLHGRRGSDPTRLHAQLSLPGFNHKPVPMVFEAHPEGNAIIGLYGTPSCRASIRLERPEDRPLQRALGR
jgi:hypothetical protein